MRSKRSTVANCEWRLVLGALASSKNLLKYKNTIELPSVEGWKVYDH
jgi:hypothetical protein